MSCYLASVAIGNEFTAVINAMISRPPFNTWLSGANYYWFFTGVMLCAAVAFIVVALRYRGTTYNPESA
jgi:POT family proton-dependent oligopeptide transporter